MTRQRAYQKRMRAAGRCQTHGVPLEERWSVRSPFHRVRFCPRCRDREGPVLADGHPTDPADARAPGSDPPGGDDRAPESSSFPASDAPK